MAEKLHNLSAQCKVQAFAMIRASDNRIKIVHSLGRYVAPMGQEASDQNHNMFFGFKGDRTRCTDPPAVHFKTAFITQIRCQKPQFDSVTRHFSREGASIIMPIRDTDTLRLIGRSVLLPIKWAAELLDLHLHPHQFLKFIVDKTVGWTGREEKYLIDWARAACTAQNKTNGYKSSQLGCSLLDIDVADEAFEEWSEARLDQTLGAIAMAPPIGVGGGNGAAMGFGNEGLQPIFDVNVLPIPQPTFNEMDYAYHRGTEAHKRATESIASTGTKYLDKEIVHLLAFCGLNAATKDELPAIWDNLQTTKTWHGASKELVKWFDANKDPWDIPYQFHKELVDDIHKLMFSMGPSPLADTAHRGISILAFGVMSVAEENQLMEEQEWRDGATTITPSALRASKRKCPSIPKEFDQFERLLVRYMKAGTMLFTRKCPHFVQVGRLRQELMLMYQRNNGYLSSDTIAGLVWEIVVDAK